MRRIAVAIVILTLLCLGLAVDTSLGQGPSATTVASSMPKATPPVSHQGYNITIGRFCLRCHNDALLTGGLTLESFDASRAYQDAERAEKIIRKLRAGMMPPQIAEQPDAASVAALVLALETTIDEAAASPNPGRKAFQRLNRAEYLASVRDLLGLEIDVSKFLPPDTISASFDNIADVQMPSATHMEGYLRAAAHISLVAVGDPDAGPGSTSYPIPRTQSQKDRVEGAPFGTRGGIAVVHNFPADGKYEFRLLVHGDLVGDLFGRTLVRNEQIEVSVDGERVAVVNIDRWMSEADPAGLTMVTGPVDIHAGPHLVAAAFVQQLVGPEDDLITPIDHTLADTDIGVGYGISTLTHLRDFSIVGPFEVMGVSDNHVRRGIFTCRPTSPEEEEPCAKRIISRLAAQAYRRPPNVSDVDDLMGFYNQGVGFEGGVRTALRALLASPDFVFRMEETPDGVVPGDIYRVSDLDLASRLSFFIWGAPPDQELVGLAARGELSNPEILNRQVLRMIADPRSMALATRFASQWLRLQDLAKVHPDALSFPYYDHILSRAMYRETELFFSHLVREDRSILELLTADYTFVNERLARHYGFPDVAGPEFRKVPYPDDRRRGILGHGSILTMTSHGNRTSPVLRGKWVMEVLLGNPPPPPPPDIPDLEETGEATDGRFLSVAEQMAAHRADPTCSSCHNVIDPIGLALDNFDVTGAWRIKDRGVEINASSELYDGTTLSGPRDLSEALLNRSDVVITHFTESLLAYALGRRVEYFDMPAIRKIVRQAEGNNFRISSFVLGIANSDAFQMAKAETTEEVNSEVQ